METIAEVQFSIVVETYNLAESSSWDRLRRAIISALAMMPTDGSGEVLIANVCESEDLENKIKQEFPGVRLIKVAGLGYDEAKARTADQARGRYVLFLDGDCIPAANWHRYLLNALEKGDAIACAGHTRYDARGFLFDLMTIMDWGFFYPLVTNRKLGCYAFNNFGAIKELFQKVPVPEVAVRCRCYNHAQRMLKRGMPVQLVPEAEARHELPPVIRERTRRGYDTIAACWADAELPEARWLRWGVLSVPIFYTWVVLLDWKRAYLGRKNLKLSAWKLVLMIFLFPFFRLMDVVGMLRAFLYGPHKGGWGGF